MEPDADTMSGQSVDDVTSDNDMLLAHRDSQRQRRSLRNVGLRAEVESADAHVLGAGYAGRIRPIEMNVDDQPGTVELAPLVRRKLVHLSLVSH